MPGTHAGGGGGPSERPGGDEPPGWSWLPDDGAETAGAEEVLGAGHAAESRISQLLARRQWLAFLPVAVLTLVVAVAAVASLQTSPNSAAQRSGISSPQPSPIEPAPMPHGYDGPALAVRDLASRPGIRRYYVRQASPTGACAAVAPGAPPKRLILHALLHLAPRYRLRDSAIVLDGFTGLCSILIREIDRWGDDLVVSVASPPAHAPYAAFDAVQTGIETLGEVTTKYALVTSRAGFRILVGATGFARTLPAAQTLVDLARKPALTW